MKAKLVPLYFPSGRDAGFDAQLANLKNLLAGEAELLAPVALGDKIPKADAVLFPQLLGEAYRRLADFKKIKIPILLVTSEFGTLSMWDWEIASYLRTEGVETVAPYDLNQTRMLCKTLSAKRELRSAKFLVFQDKPGEAGCQPAIFKRFYWWEDECIERIRDRFGVTVVKKSLEDLCRRAAKVTDAEAQKLLKGLDLPSEGLSQKNFVSAIKLYAILKQEAENDEHICGMGTNCLNESHFSDTTPCIAWNLLYKEKGIVWACEGDVSSLMTMVLLNHSLGEHAMMTNIYPFLMGMTALKHERITSFPKVTGNPDNHILLAHCGYFGLVPQCMAAGWILRPKALAIVDENAHVIDGRMPVGPITMAKLDPAFSRIQIIEGSLKDYAQFPGSDCRNGAVVEIADGHMLMRKAYSHHQCLMAGHWLNNLRLMSPLMGLTIETLA